MFSFISSKIYQLAALAVLLAVIFYLNFRLESTKDDLVQKELENKLIIESYEEAIKIEKKQAEIKAINKTNKQVVIKTQKKLKETIKKAKVSNENINDDNFTTFTF